MRKKVEAYRMFRGVLGLSRDLVSPLSNRSKTLSLYH